MCYRLSPSDPIYRIGSDPILRNLPIRSDPGTTFINWKYYNMTTTRKNTIKQPALAPLAASCCVCCASCCGGCRCCDIFMIHAGVPTPTFSFSLFASFRKYCLVSYVVRYIRPLSLHSLFWIMGATIVASSTMTSPGFPHRTWPGREFELTLSPRQSNQKALWYFGAG